MEGQGEEQLRWSVTHAGDGKGSNYGKSCSEGAGLGNTSPSPGVKTEVAYKCFSDYSSCLINDSYDINNINTTIFHWHYFYFFNQGN